MQRLAPLRAIRLVVAIAGLPSFTLAQLTFLDRSAAPSSRFGHAAFYDEPRGRVTVVGGVDANTALVNETWAIEENAWVRYPQAALAPISFPAVALDPSGGGQTVLFGGALAGVETDDTYRFGIALGSSFVRLSPPNRPSARSSAGLALDPARGAILFGGLRGLVPLGDTHVWNGSDWRPLFPTASPPALHGHSMAFDPQNQRVLLFGGTTASGWSGSTWLFDASAVTWNQVTPGNAPSARTQAAMTLDVGRGRIVLFGGRGATALDDTWEWDGRAWQQRLPRIAPPPRRAATLTWDGVHRRCILFGGYGGVTGNETLADTWAWDGTTWARLVFPDGTAPAVMPSARHSAVLAYDHVRHKTVLFGGRGPSGSASNETWESDSGRTWVRRTPAVSPPARFGAAAATSLADGNTFVLGGSSEIGLVATDLWRWNGTAWTVAALSGSPFAPCQGGAMGCLRLAGTSSQPIVHFGGDRNGTFSAQAHLIDPNTGAVTLLPTSGPGGRARASMVQHPTLITTAYLFGGNLQGGGYSNELWQLSESSGFWIWTLLVPSLGQSPAGREAASMTFDVTRQRLCVFGGQNHGALGNLDDTWYWDLAGGHWYPANPSGAPSPRAAAGAIQDPDRQRLLLVGGFGAAAATYGDVWELVSGPLGSDWVPVAMPTEPAARIGTSLVYSASLRKCVLFGGQDQSSVLNDVWTYDGAAWAPALTAGTTPPPRYGHAACVDEQTSHVIVVGGTDANVAGHRNDTWRFDGATWIPGTPCPSARSGARMVYHAAARRCILVGGSTNGGQTDTWIYDPAADTWSLSTPVPVGGVWVWGLAYDRARARVLAKIAANTVEFDYATASWTVTNAYLSNWVGIAYDAARARTWQLSPSELLEHDGSDWVQRWPETTAPAGGASAAIAYDSHRSRLVFFGIGASGSVNDLTNDLWEFSARCDLAGRARAGAPALAFHSQPVLGATFELGLQNPLGTAVVFLDIGPVQRPTFRWAQPLFCNAADFFISPGALGLPIASAATTNVYLPIPADSGLHGASLVLQAVALQAGACLEATDALHVRL